MDEQNPAPTPKRTRAPRTRQTPAKRTPLTMKNYAKATGYAEEENEDRLRIAPEILEDFRNQGIDLQWVTTDIYGQPQSQRRARFERKGWQAVHADDFGGKLGEMFMAAGSTGEVNVEGLVLMHRPMEFTMRARARELQKAREQVQAKEQQMLGGQTNVTLGGDHPSALQYNKIRKTVERISVPKD